MVPLRTHKENSWTLYHIDHICCFTIKNILNVNGFSIDLVVKILPVWQIMQASHLNMNSREFAVPDFRVLTCSKTPVLYVTSVYIMDFSVLELCT